MQYSSNKLTRLFVISAISMGALAACTDNADKTGDSTPAVTDSAATAKATKDAASTTAAAKKKGKKH